MYVYNVGTIELCGVRKVDNTVIGTFVKNGFHGKQDVEFGERTIRFPEIDGDIEKQLEAVVAELYGLGYPLEGVIRCRGDYDEGAYEVHPDGSVEQFMDNKWAVHNADTEVLIKELTRRGYTVTKKS